MQRFAALNAADPGHEQFIYTECGIWYDAIDVLSSLIQESPGDKWLRAQGTALLEQVKLAEVAAFNCVAIAGN